VGRPADYLVPYQDAARQFGDGFGALLWASPNTQRVRFQAIRDAISPAGKSILDVGCGRADYLAYLLETNCLPADYVGIEAVEALYERAVKEAAASAPRVPARIIRADFVQEPARLFAGADIVVFSGSLNTLEHEQFYQTLARAFDAAAQALVFNFLSSSMLAGQRYLKWRRIDDVLQFLRPMSSDIRVGSDYLAGDCTMCVLKPHE
jgi:SAM-dependent methyltransferase